MLSIREQVEEFLTWVASREARRPDILRLVLIAALLVLAVSPGRGATDEDIYNQLTFNFINPGGRALGMGGASIAAVVDSTASLSNPGALVMLVNDEFFAEYRGTYFDTQDFSFNVGTIGVQGGSQNLDATSPTYVSYVHQWTTKKRRQWAMAFSRQEVATIERQVSGQQLTFEDPVGNGRSFSNAADGRVDLEVVQYNVGLSGQINTNWSFGLTGTQAEMNLDSNGSSLTSDPFNIFSNANPRERLNPTTLAFSTVVNNESDDNVTGSFGLFWRPNSYYGDFDAPLRLGLTYNRGPEFKVPITVLDAMGDALAENRSFVLKVPDRYGVGFAYKLLRGSRQENRITWAMDVVWVKYEDLLDGFENGLNTFTRPGREIGTEDVDIDFTIDNGVEFRAGFEWGRFIGNNWNFDLRAGFARLPANVIYARNVFEGSGGTLDMGLEQGLRALYAKGEGTNVYTAGLSLAFVGETGLNSVVDVAYQVGENVDQAVVSLITRF